MDPYKLPQFGANWVGLFAAVGQMANAVTKAASWVNEQSTFAKCQM